MAAYDPVNSASFNNATLITLTPGLSTSIKDSLLKSLFLYILNPYVSNESYLYHTGIPTPSQPQPQLLAIHSFKPSYLAQPLEEVQHLNQIPARIGLISKSRGGREPVSQSVFHIMGHFLFHQRAADVMLTLEKRGVLNKREKGLQSVS